MHGADVQRLRDAGLVVGHLYVDDLDLGGVEKPEPVAP
jgi:hypothetical protein